ncbi:Galactose oxidase [Rhizoctonia solani]|uniref:Galactose oxidase n=1 Tax=Rhizoctonia solani TaxID=456999 RepID=A0A8H7LMM1_9AGAM|nr:Galactose oxidase [Rhizoctonia solani]
MHSVSDLTTYSRKARGDVPPPLVGASTTVIGSQMYLFGGRLVTQRRMVADLYCFHLEEYTWERLAPPDLDPNAPPPRYFHSADVWNGHLVIFGGMGYGSSAHTPDDLCVLADVRLYSLADASWLAEPPVQAPSTSRPLNSEPDPAAAGETFTGLVPRARYAHLSAVSGDQLYIIGGQDMANAWLDDIHVFDLPSRTWVARVPYPRHCGTYRSVAVCAPERVVNPARISANIHDDTPSNQDELIELPFTSDTSAQSPNSIYLYSNHNFTDVKRELQTLHPTPSTPDSPFTMTDASALLTGTSLPPGLRFPTGALLGTHLLIAGTYLAHTFQSYSLWALDLRTYSWSRIDPGAALSHGSWGRGVVWGNGGRFVVFGNREGNLVEDYNRRLLGWGDVAYVDLEAFGVYSPPRRMFSAPTPPILATEVAVDISCQDPAQTHALLPVIANLRMLHQEQLTDFEIVADDNRRIKCSSAVLEARWGWFRRQRQLFRKKAQRVEAELSRDPMRARSSSRSGVSEIGEEHSFANMDDRELAELDPRLSSRELRLSEPYAVTLALLQYLYGLTLVTSLQHAPPVLSALLLIACTYTEEDQFKEESSFGEIRLNYNSNGNGHTHPRSLGSSPSSSSGRIPLPPRPTLPQFDAMPHLTGLVKHAMHRALSPTNSVGVYEVATLCDCQSLQIRALKVVMASSKKQAHKQRQHGSGSGPSGRPRGVSDTNGLPLPGRPRTADGAGNTAVGGNRLPVTSTGRQKRLHTADGTRPREPLVKNPPIEPSLSSRTPGTPNSRRTNGAGPLFGPVPKHSPPPEPLTVDPLERTGRQGYRGLLDAVGDGLYSDGGDHYSESQHLPVVAAPRSDIPSDPRNGELRLDSRSSHAALRELYSRHRPALDEHGNPVDVDLEQRKVQIVHRWSQHVTMADSDDQHQQVDQRQPRSHVSPELMPSQSINDESSVSPSRTRHSPTTSPVFTGGASLATVSSVSTTTSTQTGSASSGGSASVRAPTDHTRPVPIRSAGHQHQGSEATVRPANQEKVRRVLVGISPYGAPIYRELHPDEPDLEPNSMGASSAGRIKTKDKVTSGGKSEGGGSGGLGWFLSPQAKAEKAAAKVQAKIEKRAREVADREATLMKEAERRKLKEEMQDRLTKIRSGTTKDVQNKDLPRIDGHKFAFMGNM